MPPGEAPKRSRPRDLSGYLEGVTRAAFQGGISWRVVDAKWEGIREAFAGFEPQAVAELDSADIDALMADSRVIRNRAKLEATVDNAQTLLELEGTMTVVSSHAGSVRTGRAHIRKVVPRHLARVAPRLLASARCCCDPAERSRRRSRPP